MAKNSGDIEVRYLGLSELREYANLVHQLSGDRWDEMYGHEHQNLIRTFQRMSADPNYFVWVGLDSGSVCATIGLVVVRSLLHSGCKVGQIENVVVDGAYRGLGIGAKLVEIAKTKAEKEGCYKVQLNCSDENVPFYERCGFRRHENTMRYDIVRP